MSAPGRDAAAGEVTAVPPRPARRAGKPRSTVFDDHGRLEAAGRQAEFEAAIDALAAMLDTAAVRTDYGSRRHALRGWVVSLGQWNQLTAGLPAHREAHADWESAGGCSPPPGSGPASPAASTCSPPP